MKIKLDENVHGDVQEALASWGHDVTTVHDESLAGRPDTALAEAIRGEGRCLVTFDLDFADARKYPPRDHAGIVVLRLRVPSSRTQLRRLVSFFGAAPELPGRLWILDEVRARDWTG